MILTIYDHYLGILNNYILEFISLVQIVHQIQSVNPLIIVVTIATRDWIVLYPT